MQNPQNFVHVQFLTASPRKQTHIKSCIVPIKLKLSSLHSRRILSIRVALPVTVRRSTAISKLEKFKTQTQRVNHNGCTTCMWHQCLWYIVFKRHLVFLFVCDDSCQMFMYQTNPHTPI